MAMVLFVGNLSRLTTDMDLKRLFSAFGEIIRSKVMTDKITRKSCGYAYVHMEEHTAAENAVKKLNSTSFMESFLIVGPASVKRLHTIDWS